MFGLKSNGFSQAGLPLGKRLSGETKHQIDVHVVESGVSEDSIGLFGLSRVVFAP